MLLASVLLLLTSNAVTIRRDKSILYSRKAMAILIPCFIISYNSFCLNLHEQGIGIYSGLFQATASTHVFHMFIILITATILQLNSFYPRKIISEQYSSVTKLLFFKFKCFNSSILNKMSEQFRIIEYPLIILFALLGGLFLITSCDLISIFLTLELQSYALYILCVVYKDSERATSGGLTYFLLGGLSSCFILLAFGLLYGNSGNTGFDGLFVINSITNVNQNLLTISVYLTEIYESSYLNFALVIMSVGFLFKVSAAPFHFWSPDVYDAIPTIVTTFVATFAKVSIFVLLLELVRFTTSSFNFVADVLNKEYLFINMTWTFTLLLSSFLSLVIGSVLGLTQFRIKRLYAYSTISHVGFILLALSVNSIESIQSFIFYLMQYTMTNINAFMLLTAIAYSLYLYIEEKKNNSLGDEKGQPLNYELSDQSNSPIQLISQIKGYFYINPFIALSLGITLFSFAGIPPLVGFFAKQMVLSSALDSGYVFMSLVGILTSVISAYYYLAIVKEMFFNSADYNFNPAFKNITLKTTVTSKIFTSDKDTNMHINNVQLSSFLTITVSILTLIILLFIIVPQEWLSMAILLALTLFHN